MRRRPFRRYHAQHLETAIELKQLRYFLRIVEMGSLSKAAGVVHIAQSALSQHVAALEAELGVPLLQRKARGVLATEAGERLYRHAQALLRQADDTKAAVASGAQEPAGLVSIGMPLSLAATLAFPIFDAVRRRYPKIRLHVYEEVSGTILEWVASGRLNLGIVFDDHPHQGLQATPLFDERLFLVVHGGSPLARRKTVRLVELARMALVVPSTGLGVRPRLERALAREGLALQAPCAELNSLALMKQAAEAGIGPTVLGWQCMVEETAGQRLMAIEIVRPAVSRTAVLCAPSSTPASPATRQVAQAAVEAVQQCIRSSHWRGVRLPTQAAAQA